jgi:Uncharacterized protein conserved in bacteria (DUF2066)
MRGWRQSLKRWPPVPSIAVLSVAAAALGLAAPNPAAASDKVYTVANYPVEAVAEDAVAAKQKALADGQQAAFRSLLKRLIPVMAYSRAKQFASVEAAELVDSVRVRSERNSRTEYVATYDFTFRAKSIRDMLRREGIPFTDEQAPVTILIPVWQAASGGAASTAAQAAWTNNWRGLDLENSLTPIKIEALRKDANPTTVAAVVSGDPGAVRSLAMLYKTDRILVVAAETDAATGRLAVILAGRDAVGPFVLKRQYRVDRADPGYAREFAAVVGLRTLEGRWKAVNTRGDSTAGAPGGTDLLISVEFRGMAEWQDISRRLSATPGVEELDVAGLSARGARVTLRFAEGAQRLAEELARSGLSLRSNGGAWVLSMK